MPSREPEADRPYAGKRAFDLVLVAAMAVPALLVGGACAIAIKLDDGGPILFRQERIGLRGRAIQVVKFRTMVDAPDNPIVPDPSRVTRTGRWLRRLSLDELPQLLNVARGEMSIVGPRPTLSYQVERYDADQRRRLSVPPGLTGLAQVRGRNAIGWAERIALDLQYIERQSIAFDLRILWWTLGAIASGSGVGGHPPEDPLSTPPSS